MRTKIWLGLHVFAIREIKGRYRTYEFEWLIALLTGPLRSHVQGRMEKTFLITETILVVTELHMFSDVT